MTKIQAIKSKPGVTARPSLTRKQKAYYGALDFNLPQLNEFPRGNEFYSRILTANENKGVLHLTVEPIVGQEVLKSSTTINLANEDGVALSSPFFLNTYSNSAAGLVLELERPDNLAGENTASMPAVLATTNSNSLDFKRKIWANYDEETIVVYQAYRREIAEEAVTLQKFGSNFSAKRTTWIKPSFLWMMKRSEWGTKAGQERILAIQLKRSAFEALLKVACLTHPTLGLFFQNERDYKRACSLHKNRVQWDPDKKFDGTRKRRKAIQIGIHPDHHAIYQAGIVAIKDITEALQVIRDKDGMPPAEVPYPTPLNLLKPLEMQQFSPWEDQQVIMEINAILNLSHIVR